MALYRLTYTHLLTTCVEDGDYPTKAKAMRAWRDKLCPTCKMKVFSERVTLVKVKVPKVQLVTCPIDQLRFSRQEFVKHVREVHP